MTMNQSCYGVIGKSGHPPYFIYFLMRHAVLGLQSRVHGSVFDTITRSTFDAVTVLAPGQRLTDAYHQAVENVMAKIKLNLEESRTLAQLRDLLLPRLMSGEIRVKDAENEIEVSVGTEVVEFPRGEEARTKPTRQATEQFKEAILVAALVRGWGTPQYPLGNKRLQKGVYFIHRKAEHDTHTKFRRHAAGPYNPDMKYRGGIGIAKRNGYLQERTSGKYKGFIAGEAISSVDQYLSRYDYEQALLWVLNTLRFQSNDDLERLSTVDYASQDLREKGLAVDVTSVKTYIDADPKWRPKLDNPIFSNTSIQNALEELEKLFPDEGGAE